LSPPSWSETEHEAPAPVFTTKEVGNGTGLGPETLFPSIRQSGGHITLASEPGAGTTFEILLPLVAATVVVPAAPFIPTLVRGTERILLVEDDETVRALARDILVAKGYDVLTAVDGEDGLNRSREHESISWSRTW
jgi:CheY-like chemotaxis protein